MKYLGRHPKTLQGMDCRGVLPAHRTSTGRRYWDRADLDKYLGRTTAVQVKKRYAYCRVCSSAQRPDLKRQRKVVEEFCVVKGLADVEYLEEIGGGLNFKRPKFFSLPKFLSLMDEIITGEVETLVIAHKDRLSQFWFDLLKRLCDVHECSLTVINVEAVSPEREMVVDLMAITHSFSTRLYGLRNYWKKLNETLKLGAENGK